MKTRTLAQITDLLGSDSFHGWFRDFQALRRDLSDCRERYQELVTQSNVVAFRSESTQRLADDMLFRAGELEMEQANAQAEHATIENDSYEMLSAFEMQRQRSSDAWTELQGAEALVEDERQKAGEVRARLEATKKVINTPESAQQTQRLVNRVKELEANISRFSGEAVDARARLEDSVVRRDQLWLHVEDAWSRSFEANMRRSECGYQARRARGDAEMLFQRSIAERRRVEELQRDAEHMKQRIAQLEREHGHLLERARQRFGCTLVREFMFWPQESSTTRAFCVPLIEEQKNFNIQVEPLLVYQVEMDKGLDFLEPVAPDGEDVPPSNVDPRLEAFFLDGRPNPTSPTSRT